MKSLFGDDIHDIEPRQRADFAHPARTGTGPAGATCGECSNCRVKDRGRRSRTVQHLVVHFVLKRHWHAEMLAGRKDIEYRAITPYWTARLTRRPVTHAAFSRGYTARGRFVRPVTKIDIGPCPYPGWAGDFYRVHLGPIMHNAPAELPAVSGNVRPDVGGFDPCCGQPPKVTEWRPGCYGAQCMECGGIVGDERQLDRHELMAEWNRVMRKRTANANLDRPAASAGTVEGLVGGLNQEDKR